MSVLPKRRAGALGHWAAIRDGKIDLYQCVVPTTWNASPRDPKGQTLALMKRR
ncbi:nickel-dependent hydrogenase large subunit [Escherichia coli]